MAKRFTCALLSLFIAMAVLPAGADAVSLKDGYNYANQTLGEILEDYMEKHRLTENNFSIAYYNIGTGESYAFNEYKWMIAASTYKLPLNMYCYELIAEGELESDQRIGYAKLSELQRQSIVYSNNETSLTLSNYLGRRQWREHAEKYSEQEYPASYYSGNMFNAQYMVDALRYVYDNSAMFETLISHMMEANPGQYLEKYVDEYEIAHKYGYLNGAVNDVGIVFTPSPYLIAIYTNNAGNGENVIGEINRIVCDYTLANSGDVQAASPELSGIYLNGVKLFLNAYDIDGDRYYNLRDIAAALDGMGKGFDVEWQYEDDTLSILSRQAYTTEEVETEALGTVARPALYAETAVYLDGIRIELTAYYIAQELYVALDELGAALGFFVTFS